MCRLRYGFGLIDASAAVNAARSWRNLSPERMVVGVSTKEVGIPDDRFQVVESTIALDDKCGFTVETVSVFLDLTHSSR